VSVFSIDVGGFVAGLLMAGLADEWRVLAASKRNKRLFPFLQSFQEAPIRQAAGALLMPCAQTILLIPGTRDWSSFQLILSEQQLFSDAHLN